MLIKKLGAICLLTINIFASNTVNEDPVSPNYARRPIANLPSTADQSAILQEKQLNNTTAQTPQKDGSNPKRANEKPKAGKKDSNIVLDSFFFRDFPRNREPNKTSKKPGGFFFR